MHATVVAHNVCRAFSMLMRQQNQLLVLLLQFRCCSRVRLHSTGNSSSRQQDCLVGSTVMASDMQIKSRIRVRETTTPAQALSGPGSSLRPCGFSSCTRRDQRSHARACAKGTAAAWMTCAFSGTSGAAATAHLACAVNTATAADIAVDSLQSRTRWIAAPANSCSSCPAQLQLHVSAGGCRAVTLAAQLLYYW